MKFVPFVVLNHMSEGSKHERSVPNSREEMKTVNRCVTKRARR